MELTERERFLSVLAANEDDTQTRMVYADWLDEQGEYDEANRQRAWPAAKAWLTAFAAKCMTDSWDDTPHIPLSFADVMKTANGYADCHDDGRGYGAWFPPKDSENALDLLEDEETKMAFWQAWETLTAKTRPPEVYGCQQNPFLCCY